MKNLSDMLEIVETREVDDCNYEICATGQAGYDDSASRMILALSSFVRLVNMRGADQQFKPAWLPRDDKIEEHVPRSEVSDEAREIFRSWVARVRQSIPPFGEFHVGAESPAQPGNQPKIR